jgi:hypothetical protein
MMSINKINEYSISYDYNSVIHLLNLKIPFELYTYMSLEMLKKVISKKEKIKSGDIKIINWKLIKSMEFK